MYINFVAFWRAGFIVVKIGQYVFELVDFYNMLPKEEDSKRI
jgi:hypothetical protein